MSETGRNVDILIVHGLIVTMDEKMTLVTDGAVAIRGSAIVAVGPSSILETQFQSATVLDATGQLVMPGLVNAHTHSPAVIFRGLTEDMRLEPWLEKSWRFEAKFVNPRIVSCVQPHMVKLATCDAARALGLGDKIGSLEEGKRADIILVDLNAVHAQPFYDVYAQLVYSLGRQDVSTVLIDGKLVMQDRQLCTLNESEIQSQLRELGTEIFAEQQAEI